MIYNSNGNNVPYQGGGNAKVNKQLKELEEAIESVNDSFNDFLGKIDLYTGEDFIHGYDGANRFTDNTNRVKALEATVNGTQGTKSLDQKILDVDDKVTALGTEVNTGDVNATNGDFHKIVSGKYTFQNGYSVTGSVICKLSDGSVVYATDGTNSILIDYTSKDAWVAKASINDNINKFKIDEYGVLAFTESRGWSVYVIGNDFVTSGTLAGTYTEILTGVTIGGNLYAALGREYDFDAITTDTAGIRIATITGSLTAPQAAITDLTATNETVTDLTANEASVAILNNSKRNFTGYVTVPTHATNINEYIKLLPFTGTYNLRLDKDVNGATETLFTATVIWNGKNPIVNYHENQTLLDRDYLYKIVLTDGGLYFVTQGDGKLYYGWDSFDAVTPESGTSLDSGETVIADYTTDHADRTVFLGDSTEYSGVDVLGELKPSIFQLPPLTDIDNLHIENNLTVDGTTTLTGDTTASNISAENLVGKTLTIADGTNTSLHADENGVAVSVDTTIDAELNVTEKTNINSYEPTEDGYYIDHDYWTKSNGVVINSELEPVVPVGTEKSRTLINVPDSIDYGGEYMQFNVMNSYTSYYLINGLWYYYDTMNQRAATITPNTKDYKVVSSHTPQYNGAVVTDNSESVLEKNAFYIYKANQGEYNWCLYGVGSREVTDPSLLAALESRPKQTYTKQDVSNIRWRYFNLTTSSYNTTFDVNVSTRRYNSLSYLNATGTNFYYTPYQELIAQPDPTHTYDTTTEVLAVNGSENVTRDLMVQGYIFQDEYHIAHLPNINANTINSNGGVLIIGELE